MSADMDLERIARLGTEFLRSEYGKYLMQQLTDLHYLYHQKAEGVETLEGKAFFVERAAGVREVIDMINREPEALAAGLLDEPKEEDEEGEDDDIAMP